MAPFYENRLISGVEIQMLCYSFLRKSFIWFTKYRIHVYITIALSIFFLKKLPFLNEFIQMIFTLSHGAE